MRVGAMDGAPHVSAARVRAARAALGPEVELMVDAHGTYTVAEAKRFIHARRRLRSRLVRGAGHRRRQGRHGARCAHAARADRHRRERGDALRLPRSGACSSAADIFQPDPGLLRRHQRGDGDRAPSPAPSTCAWRRICGPARRAFFAGLHVCAAVAGAFIVEYSLGANPMIHDLIEETVEVKDGMIELSRTRPGLGLRWRRTFLEAHARRSDR